MNELYKKPQYGLYTFASSVAESSWHSTKAENSYELWRFFALSDNGELAVSIVFIDDVNIYGGGTNIHGNKRPAVDLTIFRDGKVIFSKLEEFDPSAFQAKADGSGCSIDDNLFTFSSADYGSGYLVSLILYISEKQRIELNFEWLSIESDLSDEKFESAGNGYYWNVVAPRSDVSGKFTIRDTSGIIKETGNFRGTGVHDHIIGTREMLKGLDQWFSGTAHYNDSTILFSHFNDTENNCENEFIQIRDGKMSRMPAKYVQSRYSRTRYGVKYPRYAHFDGEFGMLIVEPSKTIISNAFMVRLLNNITLISQGKEYTTVGMSEIIAPNTRYSRWLLWLNKMSVRESG